MNEEIENPLPRNFNDLVVENFGATDATLIVLARVVNELCRIATLNGFADAATLEQAFNEAATSVLRPEGALALNKEAHRRIPALKAIVLDDLPAFKGEQ